MTSFTGGSTPRGRDHLLWSGFEGNVQKQRVLDGAAGIPAPRR
ncbi:MAG TPA: hypothetical protein VFX88_14265 [Actinomycetota bacterium]|nr:hypothetical protein [Actinomycetota bacterium]